MQHYFRLLLISMIPLLLLATKGQAADCATFDAWISSGCYDRGDKVIYEGSLWRAKRNTCTTTPPGMHKPTWADLGACDGGSEPPNPDPDPEPNPVLIFGVWHAGNHYADWSLPRDIEGEFDEANGWLIRGNNGNPAVNLVVLSFLNPLDVLNMVPNDPNSALPLGMRGGGVVQYFKEAGIRVMMSIGGITYTDDWNTALATSEQATQLGLNAAEVAGAFDVGIEIDYEENSSPRLTELEAFIEAYRTVHPYDATGAHHPARLTIDLAAGGRYLQGLNRYATTHWLQVNANPEDMIRQLDYANAMVHRSSGTPDHWQEHVDGKPQYDPPIPPKAPSKFTGGLYLKGNMANCTNFSGSEQNEHIEYVTSVAPNGAGTSNGMLGYMFWAAETPSARKNYTPTTGNNTCEGGMGVAAEAFGITGHMEPLRQD